MYTYVTMDYTAGVHSLHDKFIHHFNNIVQRARSVHSRVVQKVNWLHYDTSADAAFCHVCTGSEFEMTFLASTKKERSGLEVLLAIVLFKVSFHSVKWLRL